MVLASGRIDDSKVGFWIDRGGTFTDIVARTQKVTCWRINYFPKIQTIIPMRLHGIRDLWVLLGMRKFLQHRSQR